MNSSPKADGVCATRRRLPFSAAEIVAAFADARSLAAWWGPAGFTNTFELFEFKPQGRWRFTMHGPDGTDYLNENVFLQTSPTQVVIRHVLVPLFTLTITLTESDGGTLLTWHQAIDDAQFAAGVWHIIVPANEQNLDRLHAVLTVRRQDAERTTPRTT